MRSLTWSDRAREFTSFEWKKSIIELLERSGKPRLRIKRLLKMLWEQYEQSASFTSLPLAEQESIQEKGYRGLKETILAILLKYKRFKVEGKFVSIA